MQTLFFSLFLTVFFLFPMTPTWGKKAISKEVQKKVSSSLTGSNREDLIQKAQNLIIQKDRSQAIMILVKAISQTNLKSDQSDYKKNLEELSSLFLSDKTQQMYEAVLSNRRKDPNASIQKLNEILRIEPDHNLIISEIARLQMIKKECQQAYDLIDSQLKKNPYDELYSLSLAQATSCLGNKTEYEKIRANVDVKKTVYKAEWMLLDIEKNFLEGNKSKLKDLLAEYRKADHLDPSLTYWEARLAVLQKQSANQMIDKYNLDCKNLTAPQFRKYINNPNLCIAFKE